MGSREQHKRRQQAPGKAYICTSTVRGTRILVVVGGVRHWELRLNETAAIIHVCFFWSLYL